MKTLFKSAVLTVAAATMAVPAAAVELPSYTSHAAAPAADVQYNRHDRYDRYDRYDRDDRYDDRRGYRDGRYSRGERRYYEEPVYRNTRVWRGNDGRYYCRKSNGTTGLIIGAAGGALAGRAVDTRGERATGTILGAALGALLGREIDRSSTRCR